MSKLQSIQFDEATEDELVAILSCLGPPRQKYDVLADLAGQFIKNHSAAPPSKNRAIATYFELFGHGYALWQGGYEYLSIHEYFGSAYLNAIQNHEGVLPPGLVEMFKQLTEGIIHYTWCENALITNNPEALAKSSENALQSMHRASNALSTISLSRHLSEPLQQYFQINMHLFQGFKICADIYLQVLSGRNISDFPLHEAAKLQDYLNPRSEELASELRSYLSFARRYAELYAQQQPTLLIKQADIFIRAVEYVGQDIVRAIFKRLRDPNKLAEDAKRETGLPIKSANRGHLNDIFETVLAEEFTDQVEFNFVDAEVDIAVVVHGGNQKPPYKSEPIHVILTRLGTISVEFNFRIKDASISHMRVLESLIAPHAGRFEYSYPYAQLDHTSDESEEPLALDFVAYYFDCLDWLSSAEAVDPNNKTIPHMRQQLDTLPDMLRTLFKDLSPYSLKGESKEESKDEEKEEEDQKKEKEENEKKEIKANLYSCVSRIGVFGKQWIQETVAQEHTSLLSAAKNLFDSGSRYGTLIDIAEDILGRFKTFLSNECDGKPNSSIPESKESSKDTNIRQLVHFDSNKGWQVILSCNRIIIVHPDGTEVEPQTEAEYQQILDNFEFKGLMIQSREARSGLDDWLFVKNPEARNLATIRSHETDAVYVGENRMLLYLPDEPQFLVAQYIATARLLADLRLLVLTFNDFVREQTHSLEGYLEKVSTKQRRKKTNRLSRFQGGLLAKRSQIEDFRIQTEKILDLVRACTISKYQDHSELLTAMIKQTRIDEVRIALERNMENIDQLQVYLSELIRRKMDDRSHLNQALIAGFLFFLSVLGALSAIPSINLFLKDLDPTNADILLALTKSLFVAVLGGMFILGITIWSRNRNT